MKYLFVYYTGTYNTRFLTKKAEEKLVGKGDTFKEVEISKGEPVCDTENFDIIGLGYPIYGFNSPLPFNRYLKKMKFREGQKFFIYKNSGEATVMNDASSRVILRIMKKNKCVFLGEYHFLLPYNIHFPFSDGLISKLLEEDRKLLEVMYHDLGNGIVKRIKSNIFLDAFAFAVSIQKVGGDFNSYFYRVDRDRCRLCGKCVNSCPENNISIKGGKVVFGHNCDMCMRCSFFCPQQAIRIGMLENWRVTEYYDLEKLWGTSPESFGFELKEDMDFYKSYRRYFDKTDKEYAKISEKQINDKIGG